MSTTTTHSATGTVPDQVAIVSPAVLAPAVLAPAVLAPATRPTDTDVGVAGVDQVFFGCKKDLRSHVEPTFSVTHLVADTLLPKGCDLITLLLPDVLNQGSSLSCAACAVINVVRYSLKKTGVVIEPLSVLFLYYNARVASNPLGAPVVDDGCTIYDCFQSIREYGLARDAVWRLLPTQHNVQPPDAVYDDAKRHLALWQQLQVTQIARDVHTLRVCLSLQIPIIIGFQVYDSFQKPEVFASGDVCMPSSTEPVIGQHCAIVVSYDDVARRFLCQSSWSAAFGKSGCITLPYEYVSNALLTNELWAMTVNQQPLLSAAPVVLPPVTAVTSVTGMGRSSSSSTRDRAPERGGVQNLARAIVELAATAGDGTIGSCQSKLLGIRVLAETIVQLDTQEQHQLIRPGRHAAALTLEATAATGTVDRTQNGETRESRESVPAQQQGETPPFSQHGS
jgi:hypothetical protein